MKARLVIEYTHALVALEESRLEAGTPQEKLRCSLARILARPLPDGDQATRTEVAEARAAIQALFAAELDGHTADFTAIERVRTSLATLAREAVGET
jgi:hypothetical protein